MTRFSSFERPMNSIPNQRWKRLPKVLYSSPAYGNAGTVPPQAVVSFQPFDETAIIELARDGKYSFKFSPEAVLHIYPEATQVDPPKHTPPTIAKPYRQGRINFMQGHFEPCLMLMRKTMELALKELDLKAEGTLARKLEQAFEAKLITPALYGWAEDIKLFAHEASQDPADIPEDLAENVMAFTEIFLIYTFTLPKTAGLRHKAASA